MLKRDELMVKKRSIIVLIVFAIISIVSQSAVAINCSFIPPPSLIDEPGIGSTAPVSVTLEWNQVTGPDSDPVEYFVQVDDVSDFSSPYESGWISGTSSSISTVNLSDELVLSGFDSDGNLIGLRWNVSASEEEFGVINTTTGSFTVKGTVGDLNGLSCPSIISGNTLYVSGTNSSAQSKLYILNTTTGSLTSTVNLSDELVLSGFDSGGNLIGLRWNVSASNEEFGVIDTTTGNFTVKGTVGDLTGFFPPAILSGNILYVSGSNDSGQNKLYILNRNIVSWALTLAINKTWYWRVQARDANHTDIVSQWSFDSFTIFQPPSTPEIIPTPDTTEWYTLLRWNSVTCPDGDTVQYYVQVDNDPAFGSPDFTSIGWSPYTYVSVSYHELPTPGIYCWRVRARDGGHTVLISPWSAGDCFDFQHGH